MPTASARSRSLRYPREYSLCIRPSETHTMASNRTIRTQRTIPGEWVVETPSGGPEPSGARGRNTVRCIRRLFMLSFLCSRPPPNHCRIGWNLLNLGYNCSLWILSLVTHSSNIIKSACSSVSGCPVPFPLLHPRHVCRRQRRFQRLDQRYSSWRGLSFFSYFTGRTP